jgi:hypothetical protein
MASTENHRNQWDSVRYVTGINTRVNLLPYLGLGVIITISSKIASNEKIYNITLCYFVILYLLSLWKHEWHIHWEAWHIHKLQIPLLHLCSYANWITR